MKKLKENLPKKQNELQELREHKMHGIILYSVRSINFAYSSGEMSVTQRSALITTLPKPNKSKFYLKNWKPISLLGVDYKIALSVIANRIKKVLPTIISHTQKAF